jgi:hypothetical protein
VVHHEDCAMEVIGQAPDERLEVQLGGDDIFDGRFGGSESVEVSLDLSEATTGGPDVVGTRRAAWIVSRLVSARSASLHRSRSSSLLQDDPSHRAAGQLEELAVPHARAESAGTRRCTQLNERQVDCALGIQVRLIDPVSAQHVGRLAAEPVPVPCAPDDQAAAVSISGNP